jgi:hypothetical protein
MAVPPQEMATSMKTESRSLEMSGLNGTLAEVGVGEITSVA